MADKAQLPLDLTQVKKAVQALQAFLKSKTSGETLLLDDTDNISLLFTLWKIPRRAQTIRIPLPHGQRTDTEEICLFTRDEPKMTSEQTQRFYKRLLEEKGVKNVSEIIPYNALKKEYKPFEAKRRLLGNFDLFLSDERIRRLLPSHLGKHFYLRKKEPLCVNLQSKHLARDINRVIQGTSIKVNNKGSCCMVRVAHSGMTADEVTENIEATVQTVVAKLRTKGPMVKVIHLKSPTSVALPIYTSDLKHLALVEEEQEKAKKKTESSNKKGRKNASTKTAESPAGGKEKLMDEEEEEIPLLVPIETPRKKAKLEKSSQKRKLVKASKPAAAKKGKKTPNKGVKNGGKTKAKVRKQARKSK
ncbi:ribosomal L1 domain-containing protein 1 isoform X2 [Gouania willdenowi]|uniref:ribosomal L1 domain-containing protein 1 isoform X2 n=1 Tax=Gouania willdenowi TaxID=441366 RepID=UPI0010552C49|nr:ribosomal L1 domain-containing protein 1 isoform X2 [Gouania willdenowi]